MDKEEAASNPPDPFCSCPVNMTLIVRAFIIFIVVMVLAYVVSTLFRKKPGDGVKETVVMAPARPPDADIAATDTAALAAAVAPSASAASVEHPPASASTAKSADLKSD